MGEFWHRVTAISTSDVFFEHISTALEIPPSEYSLILDEHKLDGPFQPHCIGDRLSDTFSIRWKNRRRFFRLWNYLCDVSVGRNIANHILLIDRRIFPNNVQFTAKENLACLYQLRHNLKKWRLFPRRKFRPIIIIVTHCPHVERGDLRVAGAHWVLGSGFSKRTELESAIRDAERVADSEERASQLHSRSRMFDKLVKANVTTISATVMVTLGMTIAITRWHQVLDVVLSREIDITSIIVSRNDKEVRCRLRINNPRFSALNGVRVESLPTQDDTGLEFLDVAEGMLIPQVDAGKFEDIVFEIRVVNAEQLKSLDIEDLELCFSDKRIESVSLSPFLTPWFLIGEATVDNSAAPLAEPPLSPDSQNLLGSSMDRSSRE